MKKLLSLVLTVAMLLSMGSLAAVAEAEKPTAIKLYYSDNATLPFQEDWLTVKTIEERFNVDLQFEVIPIADYQTKVSLALNTGTNVPDVILYQSTKGENASLALNGALVPVSDYADWTPNWNARVEEFGLQDAVKQLNLGDGKRYYLPGLFDIPFYDGGLILREDFLTAKGLKAPTTYDDLYEILKAYKADYPESYPLTILAAPRVLYRMTMPAFGVSIGKNASSGSSVLSWDYTNKTYFPAAISEEYRVFLTYFAKLYAEGLLDPEMAEPIDGDMWSTKLATGASMATYAYYDQIGGVTGASEIEGFKLNMYPALAGPAGAHHQAKSPTAAGVMFPAATAKRADFEQVVRKIDECFFSEEAAKIWCLGVEGVTYTEKDGKITFADDVLASPDGIYKTLQTKYGCGSDVTQMVWYNAREMTKYDENYAAINATVASMDQVIQAVPPSPLFDDLTAEDAGLLQTPLADALEVWTDAFLTGKKSLETDWDAYVAEMKSKGIEDFCKLYNDNMAK
ncbi:MAG: extracellular solute-binding protein [Clostridia bacterium]